MRKNYLRQFFYLLILIISNTLVEGQDLKPFYVRTNSTGLYGYLNSKNDTIIKPKFDYATPFSKEATAIIIKNCKMGKIDILGNYIVRPDYEYFLDGYTSLIAVCQDGKWGYVDQELNIVIFFKFKGVSNFVNGVATVLTFNDEIHYINLKGEFIDEDVIEREGNYQSPINEFRKYVDSSPNIEKIFNNFRKKATTIWIRSGLDKDIELLNIIKTQNGTIYEEVISGYGYCSTIILDKVNVGEIIKILDHKFNILTDYNVEIANNAISFSRFSCGLIIKNKSKDSIELIYGYDDP